MAFWDFFTGHATEKWEIEKEFLKERNEQRLDIERRRKELRLTTDEKREELERKKLDYMIKEQDMRMQEDFMPVEEETDEQDSAEMKVLAPMLARFLNPQATSSSESVSSSQSINPTNPTMIHLTDAEIDELYQSTKMQQPKLVESAKGMPIELLKGMIRQQYPALDDDSVNRAAIRIKR